MDQSAKTFLEVIGPDVSITMGMFLDRANLKVFSSLAAIPSGLICRSNSNNNIYPLVPKKYLAETV